MQQSATQTVLGWIISQFSQAAYDRTHDQTFEALAGFISNDINDERDKIMLLGRVVRAPAHVKVQEMWFRIMYDIVDKSWWHKLLVESMERMESVPFPYQCLLFQKMISLGLCPDWMDRFPSEWEVLARAIQERDNLQAMTSIERMRARIENRCEGMCSTFMF